MLTVLQGLQRHETLALPLHLQGQPAPSVARPQDLYYYQTPIIACSASYGTCITIYVYSRVLCMQQHLSRYQNQQQAFPGTISTAHDVLWHTQLVP